MADTAVVQSAPNGTATAPTTPNNATGPDNAANVALPEDTPADATLISRTERANGIPLPLFRSGQPVSANAPDFSQKFPWDLLAFLQEMP